jgi:hypothetical protein
LGELPAARTILERALTFFGAVYGPGHPEVARALWNLGNVQRDLGQLRAARTNQQRALTTLEAVYGPDHPHTVQMRGCQELCGRAGWCGIRSWDGSLALGTRQTAVECVMAEDRSRSPVSLQGIGRSGSGACGWNGCDDLLRA